MKINFIFNGLIVDGYFVDLKMCFSRIIVDFGDFFI